MKKYLVVVLLSIVVGNTAKAQIDLEKLNLRDIIGKALNVKRGFAPKFALGNISIPKIHKVAEIIGLKKNNQAIKLFNTFNTGRTVYKIASYAGSAVALYGIIKKISDSSNVPGGKAALTSGLISIGSGLLVKFLTKAASYKAVDIFNGIAARKIKDIFSIKPASSTLGVGLYVKLD